MQGESLVTKESLPAELSTYSAPILPVSLFIYRCTAR